VCCGSGSGSSNSNYNYNSIAVYSTLDIDTKLINVNLIDVKLIESRYEALAQVALSVLFKHVL